MAVRLLDISQMTLYQARDAPQMCWQNLCMLCNVFNCHAISQAKQRERMGTSCFSSVRAASVSIRQTWVLPMPAGPTTSVKLPECMPPPRLSSNCWNKATCELKHSGTVCTPNQVYHLQQISTYREACWKVPLCFMDVIVFHLSSL